MTTAAADDAEKIGLYSAVNGSIEIGLGSFLHSMKIPLRSYILPAVQNFCMILFSRELKGRGLVSISAITSGLKSFSPSGAKLSPMIFIFAQGLLFSLPVYLLKHCFAAILTGSVLMQLTTMFLGLGYKYLLYGSPILEMYVSVFNSVTGSFMQPVTFRELFIILMSARISIGIIVAFVAYFLNFTGFLNRWQSRLQALEPQTVDGEKLQYQMLTWKESFQQSLKSIFRRKFLFPFMVTTLLIFFFTNLKGADIMAVSLRALLISWFSIILSMRINFKKLSDFLENHNQHNLAKALGKAMGIILAFQRTRKKKVK